jgi:hypothetical protein
MDTCNQGMGTCNQQQELLLQQLGGLQHLDVSGLVLSEPHLLTGLQSLTQLVAKRLKVKVVRLAGQVTACRLVGCEARSLLIGCCSAAVAHIGAGIS